MIPTMAYLILVAGLMGLAALLGERVCAELNRPRRSVWLAALTASIVVPAYTLFFTASPPAGTPILALPLLLDALPTFNGVANAPAATGTSPESVFSWPQWQAFDRFLIVLWIVSSALVLLAYGLAGRRLRRVLSRAPARTIGDAEVLMSDQLGPAVLGFFRPRIVLPQWLAERNTTQRTLVLSHEREHIAARDQLSLLAALLLVAAMPWNPALWWQLGRLREAVEFDCDARVLRGGADPRDYSQALLAVGRQATRAPFGAVALTEPMSVLEKRIRNMLVNARDFSVAACGARSLAVIAIAAAAFAVNAPNAQQTVSGTADAARDTAARPVSTMSLAVSEGLLAARECMQQGDMTCTDDILNELSERPNLNIYELSQLENLRAFVAFERDDIGAAMAAYETILALPREQLPTGLVAQTMRNLATLYMQVERLQEGLDLFDGFLALPGIMPSADDHYLRASLLYQLDQYPAAIAAVEQAIVASTEPKEAYYQLLLVMQFAIEDQDGMASTLATLEANWPSAQRAAEIAAGAFDPFRPGFGFAASNGEYLPIVKVAPMYPPAAAEAGIEGYVIVSYTVNQQGLTEEVQVVESSSQIFEAAAIASASSYQYRPRIIDGTPVQVAGVVTRIEFALER